MFLTPGGQLQGISCVLLASGHYVVVVQVQCSFMNLAKLV